MKKLYLPYALVLQVLSMCKGCTTLITCRLMQSPNLFIGFWGLRNISVKGTGASAFAGHDSVQKIGIHIINAECPSLATYLAFHIRDWPDQRKNDVDLCFWYRLWVNLNVSTGIALKLQFIYLLCVLRVMGLFDHIMHFISKVNSAFEDHTLRTCTTAERAFGELLWTALGISVKRHSAQQKG